MRTRTSGLTVIELLIALSVASIAFAALAYSQVTGFRVTRTSQGAAIAKDIGMKQLEIIRGLGYGIYRDCPAAGPSSESGLPECAGSTVPDEHPNFTVYWTITDSPVGVKALDPAEPPALVGVEIRVDWEATQYHLVGYLSCGDPGEMATTEVPCPSDSLLDGSP